MPHVLCLFSYLPLISHICCICAALGGLASCYRDISIVFYSQLCIYEDTVYFLFQNLFTKQAAFPAHASHCRSGIDSEECRRLLTAFGKASTNLRECFARLASRFITEYIAETLPGFNAC